MLIGERTAGDLQRLGLLARREKHAQQKDRLIVAAMADLPLQPDPAASSVIWCWTQEGNDNGKAEI